MHTTHTETELRLLVSRRREAARGIVLLELRAMDGSELPAWSPGAHIDVKMPGGIARQYSLCGDPRDRLVWKIGVLLEPESRGGSRYIHDHLSEGSVIEVFGPRNNFELVQSSHYIFIAGGIGITPLLPMMGALIGSEVTWELHYGGRSRDTMAFLDVPGVTAETSTNGRVTIYPADEVGLIDLDSALAAEADAEIYCCGPEPLLEAVERRVESGGWRRDALHLERFAAKEQGAPVRTDSFEVVLDFSDMTITVPPDQSILDAVEAAGVSVLSSCKEGTCGTCEVPVLEGLVDHRDSLLTPDERASNSTMYICVSRAVSPRLVLDL